MSTGAQCIFEPDIGFRKNSPNTTIDTGKKWPFRISCTEAYLLAKNDKSRYGGREIFELPNFRTRNSPSPGIAFLMPAVQHSRLLMGLPVVILFTSKVLASHLNVVGRPSTRLGEGQYLYGHRERKRSLHQPKFSRPFCITIVSIFPANGTGVMFMRLLTGTLAARTAIRRARNANTSKKPDSRNRFSYRVIILKQWKSIIAKLCV